MPRKITMLLIDPDKQSVTTLLTKMPRHPVQEMRRIMRAKGEIGERALYPMKPIEPRVAAQNDVEIGGATWRLRGGEDTAGRSLVYGVAQATKEREGGIVDTPVDADWIRSRIVWTPAETDADCNQRAAETLKLLDPDLRMAIAAAHVTETGEIWMSSDNHKEFGDALQAHAMVGDGVRAQRLNRMGRKVHALIEAEAGRG